MVRVGELIPIPEPERLLAIELEAALRRKYFAPDSVRETCRVNARLLHKVFVDAGLTTLQIDDIIKGLREL